MIPLGAQASACSARLVAMQAEARGPGMRSLLLACLMILPTTVTADELVARFTARTHAAADGGTLPYRWYRPPATGPDRRVPVAVLLHGTSGRGADNERQFTSANRAAIAFLLAQQEHPCAIAVPQCPADDQWVRTTYDPERHVRPAEAGPTMRRLIDLTNHLLRAEPGVDPERLYVIGNSMGGYGTWDLITRQPRVAAAIPICGGGDPVEVGRGRHVRTWAFHGAQDPIVAVGHSRRLIAALRALGVGVAYTEFPGAGHDIAAEVFATPGLAAWLFAGVSRDP